MYFKLNITQIFFVLITLIGERKKHFNSQDKYLKNVF